MDHASEPHLTFEIFFFWGIAFKVVNDFDF